MLTRSRPTMNRSMKPLPMRWAASALLLLAGQALADVPAALDRVPKDATLVVAVRDVTGLTTKISSVLKMFGGNELPLAMIEKVANTPGLNKSGSMAIFGAAHKGENGKTDFDNKDMVALVPVSNYADFVKALGGNADDKVTHLTADGIDAYAASAGDGYAAVGEETAVKNYKPSNGNLAAHKATIGKVGERMGDTADVLLVANPDAFRDQMSKGVDEMHPDGPFSGEEGKKMFDSLQTSLRSMIRDASAGLAAVSMTDAGLSMDIGANFKPGSESAGWFNVSGTSKELMAALPTGPYLFAGAADLGAAPIRSSMKFFEGFRKAITEQAKASGADMGGLMNMNGVDFEKIDGMSFVMGASPAIMQTGLFANIVTYVKTSDPAGYIKGNRDRIEASNGKNAGGIKMTAKYAAGEKEVNGTKVDTFSVQMTPDANAENGMMIQQMMMIFAGAEGTMQGFVAPTKNGVIMTSGPKIELMGKAIDALSGKGALVGEGATKVAADSLPAGRLFEMYISLNGIADTIGPFAGMMMPGGMPELKSNLPPIAMAGTMNDGGMTMRTFIPSQVMTTISDITKKMKGEEEGMDADKGDKPEKADKPGERRKPRF